MLIMVKFLRLKGMWILSINTRKSTIGYVFKVFENIVS